MAASKKVFDVAKPGKSQPAPTSRPIIVNHSPEVQDPMFAKTSSAPKIKTTSIAVGGHEDEEDKSPESTAASTATLSSVDRVTITPPSHNDTDKEPEAPSGDKQGLEADSDSVVLTEESDTSELSGASDSAAVDAIAEQANLNKKHKETPEEASKREALEKLIENKKYFLPIDEAKHIHALERILFVMLVIFLIGLVAADLAIDAGLIKTEIKPVIDLIKN